MIRKWLIGAVLIFSFLAPSDLPVAAAFSETKDVIYAASSNSNRYHKPSCAWVKKIKPENRISFSSESAAREAQYTPCKACWPLRR